MQNLKFSLAFLLPLIYNKINGFTCAVPKNIQIVILKQYIIGGYFVNKYLALSISLSSMLYPHSQIIFLLLCFYPLKKTLQ